jgi:serine/threonine-protein kinase
VTDEQVTPFKSGDVVAGRYRLEEMLGQGGMGAVYAATQLDLNRDVALKLILSSKHGAEIARKRFEREARVAAAIRHPGIVTIYDYGESEDGVLYLVMEALTGPSLRDIVDEDLPVPPLARAFDILESIAATLAVAENHGAVHRDLKPENILFDRRDGLERIVLVDFGLAFLDDDTQQAGRVTRQGVVAGTPDYLSPEQARGDGHITPASDIYTLGCIAFEMFTAFPPFTGDVGVLIARHLFGVPPSIASLRPQSEPPVPGVIEDLVARMLAKNASDRPDAASVANVFRTLDPMAPARSSEQGSEKAARLGREARMVSMAAEPRADTQDVATNRVTLGIAGDIADETKLGLAVSGVLVSESAAVDAAVDAWFVTVQHLSRLDELLRTGLPVLVEVPASNVGALTTLLQRGVAEVIKSPWSAPALSKRVRRAVKSARRKAKS